MASPFQHPAMQELLKRVSSAFNENQVWLLGHNQLVFVCGGPASAGSASVRRRFLDWAQAHIEGFRFFLAEAAAKDIISSAEPNFLNLSQFESVLADVADCVVVIPESVGSWAETGFFSALPKIRKKCLIINSIMEQGASFLNVGPIQTINEDSIFRPTFFVDFHDEVINFEVAAQRIQQFARPNRKRIQITNFEKLTGHQQFAVLHYIVSIFPSLDMDSLLVVMKALFSRYRRSRIEQMVSLLVSVEYLSRMQDDRTRFYARADVTSLIEIENVNRLDLLAEGLSFFEKYSPALMLSLEQQDAA